MEISAKSRQAHGMGPCMERSAPARKWLGWVFLAVSLILMPRGAKASLFGEENIPLSAILAEAIQHTMHLRDTVQFVKETSAFARDTARFTKESVQVARNVRHLYQQPTDFSAYVSRSWSRAFPDLEEITANVASVRQSMGAVAGEDGLFVYDPGAFARAFDELGNMRGSGYEVMAHAVDVWGVNDPHDDAIGALHEMHRESADNLNAVNQAIAGDGMTAREAAVHGARAQALTAEAQIRTATTMERLARTVELQAMRAMAAEARGASQDFGQREDATQPHVREWRLDPLGAAPSPRRRR